MLEELPWHRSQWQQINSAISNGKLHHALLLTGPEGIGLTEFAGLLAVRLLCQSSNGLSQCGECKSCILYRAGNHPDLIRIVPEEAGKQIKVEPVRDLVVFMQHTNQYGMGKIAVIEPAEAMNRSSANSLLKTLEEPPSGSTFILISYQPTLLPVTIRSRCQKINFPATFDDNVINWLGNQPGCESTDIEVLLDIANGAPLKVLEILEQEPVARREQILSDLVEIRHNNTDVVRVAEKWLGYGTGVVLPGLLSIFHTVSQIKMHKNDIKYENSNIISHLQDLSKELNLPEFVRCYDETLRHYQAFMGPINLNQQGILEDLIVFWQAIGRNKQGETL